MRQIVSSRSGKSCYFDREGLLWRLRASSREAVAIFPEMEAKRACLPPRNLTLAEYLCDPRLPTKRCIAPSR